MPVTVAITGAAGGIGSVLRTGLAPAQFRVRALDVAPIRDARTAEDIRVVDLRDPVATREALKGVDAVVHLAARPDESAFEEIYQSNILTTYHVYEAARPLGIRRVVFAEQFAGR